MLPLIEIRLLHPNSESILLFINKVGIPDWDWRGLMIPACMTLAPELPLAMATPNCTAATLACQTVSCAGSHPLMLMHAAVAKVLS